MATDQTPQTADTGLPPGSSIDAAIILCRAILALLQIEASMTPSAQPQRDAERAQS